MVGVSIDSDLLEVSRSEAVREFPMHEATVNPHTGLYGPSLLSGELIPPSETPQRVFRGNKKRRGKIFVGKSELYKPENQAVLVNAIWPRPSYIIMSIDEHGVANGLPICGGLLMSARPSIQIPLPRNSCSHENIRRTGEFVVSIPIRPQIGDFERLEENTPRGFEASGFTLLEPNSNMQTPGIKECPVNIDCKTFTLEDVPGADYAILVGRKVGLRIEREIATYKNAMQLYSQFLYAVMDLGMIRRWGFHDVNNLSVKPLPSWGSRYHGGWWTGPEQYQAGLHFWLLELVQSGYMSEEEFFKIRRWLNWWRREGFPAPEPLRSELRRRLTTLFRMMVWAHRDYERWREIHEYLARFPYEGVWWSP